MKAFLSHSSKDKTFVENVADQLRPGTYEMDSRTFDSGLVNSSAIIKALERCDLFCLFLSETSTSSHYVDFETAFGIELFAKGRISRLLIICIDDVAFNKSSTNILYFNIIRKAPQPGSAARLIQGHLISAKSASDHASHPFIGRESALIELEKQVTDNDRPLSKAIFISGNHGSGRRTFARKFYEDQFAQVNRVFPAIVVDQFSGLEELYRNVARDLRPAITASDLRSRLHGFSISSAEEKFRQIADMINSLLPVREAVVFYDRGGLLTDEGTLQPEINGLFAYLEAKPYPPVIIVAPRMIPTKFRRPENDISYVALKSLDREAGLRLLSRLLKDASIVVDTQKKNDIYELTDGHPYNFYQIIDRILEAGIDAFLASPRDFIEWKHRQSSEYISKLGMSDEERHILGILKMVPELDFEAFSAALDISASKVSEALQSLVNKHVVEAHSNRFSVSPALRIAVERNSRTNLPGSLKSSAIRALASTLSVRLDDGTASVALIDAAVLSSIESGGTISSLAAAFMLPSHYVWLAKRHYDDGDYPESIRLAKEALKGAGRLSSSGKIAACRFLCLAATRLGDLSSFAHGIQSLESSAHDNWAKSNVAFLRGFNARFRGHLPDAEQLFRESYSLSPGNISAARELAAICLARGNLEEAETFAREAHSHGRSNEYLIDILIAVLIKRYGKDLKKNPEIDQLFDDLERVGEEKGRSFFTTRKAEFEHLWGNNKTALALIDEAVRKTPNIFEPQRLKAEILLKDGQKNAALEVIQLLGERVNARDPSERRSYYRGFLETKSHYLQEVGRFSEAKELFEDESMFTSEERQRAVREIETVQAYTKRR